MVQDSGNVSDTQFPQSHPRRDDATTLLLVSHKREERE